MQDKDPVLEGTALNFALDQRHEFQARHRDGFSLRRIRSNERPDNPRRIASQAVLHLQARHVSVFSTRLALLSGRPVARLRRKEAVQTETDGLYDYGGIIRRGSHGAPEEHYARA